jgi:hypothetical protein
VEADDADADDADANRFLREGQINFMASLRGYLK